MVDRLPWARPFRPAKLRWRLSDARIEGPGSYDLPADVVTTDGGGWWTASFGDNPVLTPAEARALRAFAFNFRGGRIVDVPFVEQEPVGGLVNTPFSDGSPFSDGREWSSGLVTAVLEEAAGLRADELEIRITSGHALHAFGDMFSLFRGFDRGSELHGTAKAEQLDEQRWRVRIAPGLRQAHAAGTEVNFNDPHCGMRVNDIDGRLWPEFGRGWNASASILLEEAVR